MLLAFYSFVPYTAVHLHASHLYLPTSAANNSSDWTCYCRQKSRLLADNQGQRFYFVHSFRATPSEQNKDWVLATSHYGEDFVATLQRGDTYATQFHPEKSGAAGLTVLKNFFESYTQEEADPAPVVRQLEQQHVNGECWYAALACCFA